MQMPKFSCYVRHTSNNYGLNSLCSEADGRDFYFSYRTLVAFRGRDGRLIVRQNDWGPTTGRHLNTIDNGRKDARLASDAFEAAYAAEMRGEYATA